jgi:hypothetical protein
MLKIPPVKVKGLNDFPVYAEKVGPDVYPVVIQFMFAVLI